MLEEYAKIRAIRALASRPNCEFSVRSLAKEAGISPAAAGSSLEWMKEMGIADLRVVGRTYQYRANLQSALCRQWKALFSANSLVESGVVWEILQKVPDVFSIMLYGSRARGTDDEKSDYDLLAIAHKKTGVQIAALGKLDAEANFSLLSQKEWEEKARKDKVFYENVIYESIVLYGNRPVVL